MRFVLIDETIVDRGWWALVSGIDLNQFKKNPLMYWIHKQPQSWQNLKDQALPIGRWEDIKVESINGVKSITATPVFDENDKFARKIKDKVDNNFIRMASAGLIPIAVSDEKIHLKPGQTRATLTVSRMVEASIVDIGGNHNAVRLYNKEDGQVINLSDGQDSTIPPLKTKQTDMKIIALKLGLKEDATEAEILSAIDNMIKSEKSANETAETLQSERVAELLKSEAVTDDNKESIEELAKIKFELAQKMVATLEAKAEEAGDDTERLSAVLKKKNLNKDGEGKDKKWEDLSDEERIKLREENQADYVKLYAEHYGHEPKID